jgi:hypothetical protein
MFKKEIPMLKAFFSMFVVLVLGAVLSVPAGAAMKKHQNPLHERRQAARDAKKEVYKAAKEEGKKPEVKELKEEANEKKQEIIRQNRMDRKALKKELDVDGDGLLSKEELAVGKSRIEAMRVSNKAEWEEFRKENAEAFKALEAEAKAELDAAGESSAPVK